MKKILLYIFILMIILTTACKQTVKKDAVDGKKVEPSKVATTGEASVDAVGNDLNYVNSVEKDLSADELSDLDAGLDEIQKI